MIATDLENTLRKLGYRVLASVTSGEAAVAAADTSTEDRLRVLSSGYHLHMPKPMEPSELATAVAQLAKKVSDVARARVVTENLKDG